MSADMLLHRLVFLLLTAAATGQSGIPRHILGQWILTDDGLEYEVSDGGSVAVVEAVLPDNKLEVVELEEQQLPITPVQPYVMKQQDFDGEDSSVWMMFLVVGILLVSILGTISTAYYLCVWRGGRIHYQRQKDISAFI
ncbi:hypothetical protein LDENG_00221940 [Lucifuga dentata]|nr:hypothetical protein LDENG_00221940 [Lucifuga dentata]